MPTHTGASTRRALRLAILDDNPFVRDVDGGVRPVAALFHRFAETVVAIGPFEPAAYLIPVREPAFGAPPSRLGPVDERCLRVVPTAAFDGIAGYVGRAPQYARRNWPVIRETVALADLVWIKAPASNGPLAALACRRAGVPRFTWVAGSVRDVVRGQSRGGMAAIAARALGVVYDGTTRFLERTGPAIRLDDELFTSVVSSADVEATRARPDRADPGRPARLAWAGRVSAEKGLDDLLVATASLGTRDGGLTLEIIGDGPARPALEARAAQLGLDGRVRWRGYLGDRDAYLDALRDADLFVLPSHAEGMPKVLVEAMAAGLPVVATTIGAVPAVLDHGNRGRLVPVGAPTRLADAIAALLDDLPARSLLRERGLDFAASHTAEAQAHRLVSWMRRTFPALPWPDPGPLG